MKENFIYVLSCFDAVKIGKTVNVKKRFSSHKTSNPFVTLESVYELPEWCENYIHHHFRKHLRKDCTEWFNYYEGIYSDIDNIVSSLRSQMLQGEEKRRENKKRYLTHVEKSSLLLGEMFSLGMPNTEIGERLGVTEGAIRKRLLKLGLVKNKSSNRYIQKILEKKKEGVSNTQIAKLLSISEGYVRKILKNENLQS